MHRRRPGRAAAKPKSGATEPPRARTGSSSAAVGRGAAGAINAKYGADPGQKIYTHVSDQYAPFHSQLISATAAEAPHVIDGLLHPRQRASISSEHYTDTGRGDRPCVRPLRICSVTGSSPRIRDLADRRLGTFEAGGPLQGDWSL